MLIRGAGILDVYKRQLSLLCSRINSLLFLTITTTTVSPGSKQLVKKALKRNCSTSIRKATAHCVTLS